MATATPSLGELRQECKIRLLDFEKPPRFQDDVYDYEINRQLDLWTAETSILQVNYLSDIIANVNPTILTPLPGYQLGQVLGMAIRQNGQTVLNLEIRSPHEMYREFVDWPDTQTNSSTPMFAVFDFDPNVNGHILQNAVTLWPGPSQSWTSADASGAGGLVVTCKATTNKLLIDDNSCLPMLARYAKEPIVEKVCATLLSRIGNELAGYHQGEAMGQERKIRRAAGLERHGRRSTTSYNV